MQTPNSNPWKGLNYYLEGETLYGRDIEIPSLAQYITGNTQTVLYGKSGIGKSSIINAGIFPIARQEGLHPIPIRLKHDEDSPYVQQIKAAFIQSGIGIHENLPPIDSENETLWEYLHRHTFTNSPASTEEVRPLIVFDQFEEIFTLQHNETKKLDFFSQLADLINEVTPPYIIQAQQGFPSLPSESYVPHSSKGNAVGKPFTLDLGNSLAVTSEEDLQQHTYTAQSNFNIVFTIREDFLSYLERYTAYIPRMKSNRYALLPINEEQAADIITKPCPGLVSREVANLIIQKVSGRTDFTLDNTPEIEVDSAVLSLYLSRLYIKKGEDQPTITSQLVNQFSDDIIKDFYESSVGDLPASQIEKLEDQLLTYDGRRNNVSRSDLIREGITPDVIQTLVEDRKLLRQFSYQDDIRIEFMHDILCPIVDERINQRELAKQQEEENRLREEEQRQLLIEEQRKRAAIEAKARVERRKMRTRLITLVVILISAAISAITIYLLKFCEFKESFANFTTEKGWPIGIGDPLKEPDKQKMPVHYQLVRKGFFSHAVEVHVLNSHGKPVCNILSESPLVGLYETEGEDQKAKQFATMQRQTAYWIYTPDLEGNIARKTAYNLQGEELYAVQYFRSEAQQANTSQAGYWQEGTTAGGKRRTATQLWATYIDPDGKSLPVRDNGADRLRILVNDSTGYYTGYLFFSETGTPQANQNGAYGYRYKVADDGHILSRQPLDAFGDPITGRDISYEAFDPYQRWTKSSIGSASYSQKQIVFSTKLRTDSLTFTSKGELASHAATTSDSTHTRYLYAQGQVKEISRYRKTPQGLQLSYQQRQLPSPKQGISKTLVYWADSIYTYRIKQEQHRPGHASYTYFCGNSPTDIHEPLIVHTADGQYHQLLIDTVSEQGLKIVTKTYLDTKGQPSPTYWKNRDVTYYNKKDEIVRYIAYHDSTILHAYLYENDHGQIVAQSVFDPEATGDDCRAMRYPAWDLNHYSYYKMKLVYNFTNTLVAVKGINEFGEESLIMDGDMRYVLRPMPSTVLEHFDLKNKVGIYGLQMYSEEFKLADPTRKVEYIRITDHFGTWHRAGIRTGDLLVSLSPRLTVARPNPARNSYDLLHFSPSEGERGAEHYAVYFTASEMKRYNNAIHKKK